MGILTHRINKESLKPGDHIYCWSVGFICADHGIYIGDDKVIHLVGCYSGGECRLLNKFLPSKLSRRLPQWCQSCTQTKREGIICSCLNCFLAGRVLRCFEYGVNAAVFIAKVRGGTCTQAASDSADSVVHRAKYLLDYTIRSYELFKNNNSEEFAIYCKTGVGIEGVALLKGQAASIPSFLLAAWLSAPLHLSKTNGFVIAATLFGLYGSLRCIVDISRNGDETKVIVEDLLGNHKESQGEVDGGGDSQYGQSIQQMTMNEA